MTGRSRLERYNIAPGEPVWARWDQGGLRGKCQPLSQRGLTWHRGAVVEGGHSDGKCAHMQGSALKTVESRVGLKSAAPASRSQGTR